MAYIDKRKIGGKTHYYLGKTIRIGPNKWKKIRVKLGTKKPTKELISKKLKELKLEEYKIFNDPYIDSNKLEIIDDFKQVYNDRIKKIPESLRRKEEEDFVIRFTYNSNAIEGNKLTLRDTYLVINKKQIPTGAPAKDYTEAINGKEALDYIKNYKGKLTIEFVEKLNYIITKNTGIIYPGRIRFFSVKILGSDFIPPGPDRVKPELKNMIKFYEKNKKKVHPFVLSLMIHGLFEEIHPFEDGNGRTGRAILNWILMKSNYPKLFVPVKSVNNYYKALDYFNKKECKKYIEKMFEVFIEQLSTK